VSTRKSRSYANVTFLDEAVEDLRRIAKRSPEVVREVFRLLKQLDTGELLPRRLQDYAKTGDLTDCGKIVVALDDVPEHRIVVRDIGRGTFEVCEVITVEARTEDLAYLLAGVRLGRIDDPVRRSDIGRRVNRIQEALGRTTTENSID
jgi:mRNA-degrading endonuclease YafQ of YafQ-DinJ toxin-antitoxin module